MGAAVVGDLVEGAAVVVGDLVVLGATLGGGDTLTVDVGRLVGAAVAAVG